MPLAIFKNARRNRSHEHACLLETNIACMYTWIAQKHANSINGPIWKKCLKNMQVVGIGIIWCIHWCAEEKNEETPYEQAQAYTTLSRDKK
jgi:hypothetical protein